MLHLLPLPLCRQLLRTLTTEEVHLLEKALCSNEHSWEDIEKQLNELQLSYEESGSYYDAQSYISPVESSVTECETACSSVPSLSMLEDRLRFDPGGSWCEASGGNSGAETRRKCSLPPPGSSIPDNEVEYCHKGHAKSEGINIPTQKRRRRRSQPPVVSPESLDAVTSSNRRKGTKLQTSRRKSSSESEKKVLTDCKQTEETVCNGTEATVPPCHSSRTTVEREDSGLGTPSHCCSMETTSPESCQENFSCNGMEVDQGLEGVLYHPQSQSVPENTVLNKDTKEDNIFREDKNTKRKLHPPELSDLKTNGVDGILHFGKGLASTELNTTDSVGTSIHDVFDNEAAHSLMWATVDSSADTSLDSDSTSSQMSRLRLRNPSGSSTGSNIQTTSGMNRVTGILGLAAAPSNRTGSTGSSVESCGSSCSCCSYSDDEDEEHNAYQWESDDR